MPPKLCILSAPNNEFETIVIRNQLLGSGAQCEGVWFATDRKTNRKLYAAKKIPRSRLKNNSMFNE